MKNSDFDPPVGSSVIEAATWLARRSDGLCEDGDTEFRAWITASADNRRAWEDATRIWALAGSLAAHPEIIRLRADAVAAQPVPGRRRSAVWGLAIAASAAVLWIGGAAWFEPPSHSSQMASATYDRALSTGLGERATFALPDGTALTLNTRSRAVVHFSKGARRVTLLEGQALFQVAKDPRRPFVVRAADREITAVGTEFDVRLFGSDRVRVSLIEGKVKIAEVVERPHMIGASVVGPAIPQSAVLEPGEQLVTSGSRETSIHAMDAANVTSWRDGRMVFANTALIDAVSEVNRYTAKPIRITDPDLRKLRISGTFRTGQPDGFIVAITEYFPVLADDEGDRIELRFAAR
ncbi:MAG: DUF4974 domain-containing protein [Sphingomonadales bacterium]|nr:MAG: DUF4974 domain-containing protein [Sphingomonadales bacterium]